MSECCGGRSCGSKRIAHTSVDFHGMQPPYKILFRDKQCDVVDKQGFSVTLKIENETKTYDIDDWSLQTQTKWCDELGTGFWDAWRQDARKFAPLDVTFTLDEVLDLLENVKAFN